MDKITLCCTHKGQVYGNSIEYNEVDFKKVLEKIDQYTKELKVLAGKRSV